MKESYLLVFACNFPLLCSEIMPILASKAAKKKVQERIGYLKVKAIFQFQLKLEENVETMQLTKTNFIQAKVVSHSMFNLLK